MKNIHLVTIILVLLLSVVVYVFATGADVTKLARQYSLLGAAGCDTSFFNISPPPGQTFSAGCLEGNTQLYGTDNRYSIYRMPTYINNATYIKTSNSEIMHDQNLSWSITLNKPATVYIMSRHIPGVSAPDWIADDYQRRTDDAMNNIDQYLSRKNSSNLIGEYDIYSKEYPATNVTFFGAGDTTTPAYSMYVVALQPFDSNPDGDGGSTNPTPTPRPGTTNPPNPTNPPNTTAPPTTTSPPVSGDFPCGKFPNANPGCINVSYQSWFDNVAASETTMNVNYTPRLLHQHYDCAVPAARANGQYIKRGQKVVCQFTKYNSIIPSLGSNKGWYRTQNVGDTFEQFTMNLPACQSGKYQGKTCISENVHTIRDSDFSKATEMRLTPNAEFVGMGGQRHYLSTNWQTGIGYRSTSEVTARYWIGECGEYQRTILPNIDKYLKGNEAIPIVKGTITIPFETNGGCGSVHKTFAFLDPNQHVVNAGTQTGTTLMETNNQFKGNLTWDTTKTSNGVHNVLFINMEGKTNYVSASGVAIKFNVQN
jgi:hypothetical protein